MVEILGDYGHNFTFIFQVLREKKWMTSIPSQLKIWIEQMLEKTHPRPFLLRSHLRPSPTGVLLPPPPATNPTAAIPTLPSPSLSIASNNNKNPNPQITPSPTASLAGVFSGPPPPPFRQHFSSHHLSPLVTPTPPNSSPRLQFLRPPPSTTLCFDLRPPSIPAAVSPSPTSVQTSITVYFIRRSTLFTENQRAVHHLRPHNFTVSSPSDSPSRDRAPPALSLSTSR
ncbi:target of rapamycin homolog, partial [Striga asiatica]